MNILPYHSVVFFSKEDDITCFPKHEILSKDTVEKYLIGDNKRYNTSYIITRELYRLIKIKLHLGERILIEENDLTDFEIDNIEQIALSNGATVDYFTNDCIPALPFNKNDWKGMTIIGDVHGNRKSLHQAFEWAEARKHYIWLLGDIIDYGEDTLYTMNDVYHMVMSGKASMNLGNHETRILKWIEQKENNNVYIKLTDGNMVTANALEELSDDDKKKWIGRFRSLVYRSSIMYNIDNITLVHAAVHPSLWTDNIDKGAIETFSLYGETSKEDDKLKREYSWVDFIPKNKMVFKGHDSVRNYPIVKTGKLGGNVIFLDTGSGKNGNLSSADLKFEENNIRLECFKVYE